MYSRAVPRIVDHEARRSELSQAVWRVIARAGLQGVTNRAVAAEAGWSTGVVDHYFADKADLLLRSYREAIQRSGERALADLTGRSGLDRLRAVSRFALPLDEESTLVANVWLAFNARAVGDPALRAAIVDDEDDLGAVFVDLVVEAQRAGEIDPAGDPVDEAMLLAAVLNGLTIDQLTHPEDVTPADTERLFDRYLERITTRP